MEVAGVENNPGFLLLGLEVVEDDGTLRRLLAPVLNYDTRAVDDLARVTLPIQDT